MTAVSFDADGTLWDFDKVMRNALATTLEELRQHHPGSATSRLTVDEMIAVRDEVAAARQHDWSRLEDIRLAAFTATLKQAGIDNPALAADLNALYLHHRFANIELYPDVLACLDAIARHHTVGLLSNGNSYPERCGLDGRFAFTVIAEEHGVAKPDPTIFEIAAEAAGCPVEQLVHVGDGETDIIGARRAGCRSVLINRTGADLPHAAHADAEIHDLRALPTVIDQMRLETRGSKGSAR